MWAAGDSVLPATLVTGGGTDVGGICGGNCWCCVCGTRGVGMVVGGCWCCGGGGLYALAAENVFTDVFAMGTAFVDGTLIAGCGLLLCTLKSLRGWCW